MTLVILISLLDNAKSPDWPFLRGSKLDDLLFHRLAVKPLGRSHIIAKGRIPMAIVTIAIYKTCISVYEGGVFFGHTR